MDYPPSDGYLWSSVCFSDPADVHNASASCPSNYVAAGTTPLLVHATSFTNTIGYVGLPPNRSSTAVANQSPTGLWLNLQVDYRCVPVP
ncbi:MAG: hypothetical protein WCP21_07395 [Armatimonadota bacterium]